MIEKVYIIPVQDACNCNCNFCISKSRNYEKQDNYMSIDNNFFNSLEILRSLNIKKVEITGGGEPLIHSDIQLIINYIREYLSDCYIKIYTNGRLEVPVINVDEINISLADVDDANNMLIMGYKDCKKNMDIIKFYRNFSSKVRLSIPIIKGAIDSEATMMELIEKTDMHVDEYVLRTLYNGTPNIEDMYADFNINHKKVIVERNNCLCDFKNRLIMWSDNKLYDNWDLNKQYSLIKRRR